MTDPKYLNRKGLILIAIINCLSVVSSFANPPEGAIAVGFEEDPVISGARYNAETNFSIHRELTPEEKERNLRAGRLHAERVREEKAARERGKALESKEPQKMSCGS